MKIHWCGTGLSSGPGLRRLIATGHDVVVWNRDVAEARATLRDPAAEVQPWSPAALADALRPGDIAVSMLPADLHMTVARICLGAGAHFVSSSYISAAMRGLDEGFRHAGAAALNEVGLDPGLDHLMAHDLIGRYRASAVCDAQNALSFRSFCGGFPRHPNAFRYKFSWSPLGVLRALGNPARMIRDFTEVGISRPWQAVSPYDAPLPQPERFEVYPNRDSLPFIADYHLDPAWKIREFQRGTLRLTGWAEAWAAVFAEMEALPPGDAAEKPLAELAARLWHGNAYAEDEPDRVVLVVSLLAERQGRPVWHESWALDATGDARGSAMARLVSGTVALAVEAVAAREIPAGVHPAPHDPRLVSRWLEATKASADYMARVDHLT